MGDDTHKKKAIGAVESVCSKTSVGEGECACISSAFIPPVAGSKKEKRRSKFVVHVCPFPIYTYDRGSFVAALRN